MSMFGSSRLRSSATCLIRKLPNETPLSPAWRFEIEDRGRRLVGRHDGARRHQQRLDRVRDVSRQRHLDENEGVVDHLRVEEGEETPVLGLDAPAQVVPVADRVHGLVADDLLEDVGRRRPADATQHEEAAVEPRAEQVPEVAVEHLEHGCILLVPEQLLAHAHEPSRAARREVEPADDLLALGLGGRMQLVQRRRAGASRQAAIACSRRCASGPKSLASRTRNSRRCAGPASSQRRKISRASASPEASPRRETSARLSSTRSARARRGQTEPAGARRRDRRRPAFRDRGEDLAQERGRRPVIGPMT